MDYPYIRAWGQMLGSQQSYITDQVTKAKEDRAPADAVYKRDHVGGPGDWARFADVTSATTIDSINRIFESRGWSA